MNETDLAKMLTGAVADKEAVFRLGKVTDIYPGDTGHAATVDLHGQVLTNVPLLGHIDPDIPDGLWMVDMGKGRWMGVGSYGRPSGTNLVENGQMLYHPKGSSVAGITTSGYHTAAGWRTGLTTLGTWTQSIETATPPAGFKKSLKMLCTTADASPAAADVAWFDYPLDGWTLVPLAKGTASAKPLTVSFMVRSNLTGTFYVFFRDIPNNRACAIAYTINAANTWERKTVTAPGDVTGALNLAFDQLRVSFVLGSGSDHQGGSHSNAWQSYASTAGLLLGQTNVAAATNNFLEVTGVQVEVGRIASPYQYEPWRNELFEKDTLRKWMHDGSGWIIMYEPWQGYTPTLSQGASTDIAKTVAMSQYQRSAGNIKYWVRMTSNGNGTSGAAIVVSLPGSPLTGNTSSVGAGLFYRSSTAIRFTCQMELASATAVGFGPDQLGGGSLLGNLWNVASGDAIRFQIEYEMSSPYSG